MNENNQLERITFDPKIFNGKPIIRGKRIAVEHILGMIAEGATIEELLEGYTFLEKGDIKNGQKRENGDGACECCNVGHFLV